MSVQETDEKEVGKDGSAPEGWTLASSAISGNEEESPEAAVQQSPLVPSQRGANAAKTLRPETAQQHWAPPVAATPPMRDDAEAPERADAAPQAAEAG